MEQVQPSPTTINNTVIDKRNIFQQIMSSIPTVIGLLTGFITIITMLVTMKVTQVAQAEKIKEQDARITKYEDQTSNILSNLSSLNAKMDILLKKSGY